MIFFRTDGAAVNAQKTRRFFFLYIFGGFFFLYSRVPRPIRLENRHGGLFYRVCLFIYYCYCFFFFFRGRSAKSSFVFNYPWTICRVIVAYTVVYKIRSSREKGRGVKTRVYGSTKALEKKKKNTIIR